jgi:hypothetical protein
MGRPVYAGGISMIVAVTGGRNYQLTDADRARLDELRVSMPIDLLLSGHARGADMGCELWARKAGVKVETFPAQWDLLGPCAGFVRNQEMANMAQALIVFPGGNGTRDMAKRCIARKMLIQWVAGSFKALGLDLYP